jgi:Spy/CpxP family protein refolding chaperone
MLVRLFLTAVVATGVACAQIGGGDEGGMGGMGGGGGRGGRGGGGSDMGGTMSQPRRLTRVEQLFEKLRLNKEQKEQAVTILSAASEKAAPVREQLNKGRIVMANNITSKGSDEDLKNFMNEYTKVNVVMTSIEAEAFGKLYAILKPNQQAKAPQAFELMAGMFSGGMPGGGGRGRGEGRQ